MTIDRPGGDCFEVQAVDAAKPTFLPAQPVGVEVAEFPAPQQVAMDEIDEASMESFPCSDPPGYTMLHM